jgi:myo-inositol-1(or 4)-monophosphatase
MAHRSALINVMVTAAFRAARGLNRDFGEVENLQVSRKGPADFVSTADLNAEAILFRELSRARPEFGFLMEERGSVAAAGAAARWIVDPLDGTTNFLHGLPHFAISIAAEENGQIVAGIIYDPLRDELFWADKGRGAYLNDQRLRVAARHSLDVALLATGIPFKGRGGQDIFEAEISLFMAQVAGIRRFGSAALDLAYVAAGRFDGFWERNLEAWDIAAGVLIVREAGGYVTDLGGGEIDISSGRVLAANDRLHARMLKVLKEAEKSLKA